MVMDSGTTKRKPTVHAESVALFVLFVSVEKDSLDLQDPSTGNCCKRAQGRTWDAGMADRGAVSSLPDDPLHGTWSTPPFPGQLQQQQQQSTRQPSLERISLARIHSM